MGKKCYSGELLLGLINNLDIWENKGGLGCWAVMLWEYSKIFNLEWTYICRREISLSEKTQHIMHNNLVKNNIYNGTDFFFSSKICCKWRKWTGILVGTRKMHIWIQREGVSRPEALLQRQVKGWQWDTSRDLWICQCTSYQTINSKTAKLYSCWPNQDQAFREHESAWPQGSSCFQK